MNFIGPLNKDEFAHFSISRQHLNHYVLFFYDALCMMWSHGILHRYFLDKTMGKGQNEMGTLVEKYLETVEHANITDELGIIKIKYAISIITNELVKTALLMLLFYALGQFSAFVWVMLLILPLRLSTGGIHLNSSISCFLFSTAYFLLCICFLPAIRLPMKAYVVMLLLSVILTCILPLAPSRNRPIVSQKKYWQNKCFSIIYLVLFAALILPAIIHTNITKMIIWALLLHTTELVAVRLRFVR